jgi:hypothetical protein
MKAEGSSSNKYIKDITSTGGMSQSQNTGDTKYQLTHLSGSERSFTRPGGDYKRIDAKLGGDYAEIQQGFTAIFSSDINQGLKENSTKGVKISKLLKFLNSHNAQDVFQPLDEANAKLGLPPGSETAKSQMIKKLEEMKKANGDIAIRDPQIGPMYRSIIEKHYPETFKLLDQPFQYRADTKKIRERLGLPKGANISDPRYLKFLQNSGYTVLNEGKPLSGNFSAKRDLANVPSDKMVIYANKKGKLNIIDPSNRARVEASFTMGKPPIPPLLSSVGGLFTTKSGSMTGLSRKNPLLKMFEKNKKAKGGSVPSLLTPGEFVVGKEAAAKNRPFLEALNAGQVKNYATAGNVMLGPQTKRQAAMTSFRGGLGTAGTVAAGASIPLMFAGQMMAQSSNQFAASIGSFVNSMTPALFGLQLLGPLLPKLANPIGLAIGATAALAFGTYKVVAQIKKLEDSGAALTRAMYGSSKTVDQMAAAFGRQTATQQVTSTLAQRVGGAVGQPAAEVASQFVGTDAGKQLIADVELVKKAGGDAITALKNQLARSVIAGVITAEEARGVAIEIGKTLNDQQLAVNVSAQLTQLIGTEGELIKGNEIKLIGKITPKFDIEEIDAIVAELFAQNTSGFWGGITKIFTDDDVAKNKIAVGLIGEATAQSFKTSEESVSNFKLAVIDGSASLDEYSKKTNELGKESQQAAQGGLDAIANKLKTTKGELNNLANQKSFVGGRGGGFLVPTGTAKLLETELNKTKTTAQSALKNMGLTDTMVEQVKKGLSTDNFVQQMEAFGMITGGALTDEMERRIEDIINKSKGYLDKNFRFDELLTTGKTGGKFDANGNPSYGQESEVAKSALQLLLERITLTKQQTAAISGLIANGLNPEAAAALSAEEATQIYNKSKTKQSEIFKKINDDSIRQRVLTAMGLSQDQKAINLNNLRVQGMNLEIAQNQKQIDQVTRLNELDTRQVAIRQRALDVLNKKEKTVNDLYANRTKALDEVAQANERANQQQRNSIALASALTSGDFGAAASAAAQMTSDSASNQIQDTKTALEAQRQAEISALTTDINGKLMTRAEIEAQIDTYNENIYQRTQSTLQYEDTIYNIKSNIAALEMENDLTQQRIAITQVQVEASMAKQAGYSKSIRDYYQEVLSIMGKFPKGAGPGQNRAYGGSIQKLMYGGISKGSSESPPSLKFANGNIVPGTGMTDKVSALLTPGEFVVRKSVAQANMPLLKSLNSNVFGAGMSVGSPNISPVDATTSVSNVSAPVYNYNVNVNVTDTDASPNEIADVVMNKIRMTKDRSVRGNRY